MALNSNNSCVKIFIQVLRGKMLNDTVIYLDISFLQIYKISLYPLDSKNNNKSMFYIYVLYP